MSIDTGQIVNRVVGRHLVPHRYDGTNWVPIAIDAAQVAALKAESVTSDGYLANPYVPCPSCSVPNPGDD